MSNLTTQPVDLYVLRPAGSETDQALTVDATAGGVQFAAWGRRVSHIFYTVADGPCRFTLDDSAPTATNGHLLYDKDSGVFPRSWFAAAKFIRTAATDAVIHASPLTESGS